MDREEISVRFPDQAFKSPFHSFMQAGFECSTHVLPTGRRLDVVAATDHDRLIEADFDRAVDCGFLTVREGLRWHLIEKSAATFDFSSALPIIEAAQRRGIQIIWDLFHFGWPAHLDIFAPEWVDSFTRFASEFGRLLRREMSETPFVAPANEISFVSWAGGDVAYLNPFARGRGAELKRQLVRAAIQATVALRTEIPNVRLVSPEPVIHIVGDPAIAEDLHQAEEYRSSMFEAWDMLSGRLHPELGGDPSYLDIIGINYYGRNQWWNHGGTILRDQPEYRPFREILSEVHERYGRPMFISETGAEDEERAGWFSYIADEVRAAKQSGTPIHGICLYPILNHPGWDDDRHCRNGLWDYARPDGTREIYQPLADAIEHYKTIESETNDNPTTDPGQTGFDLPLPPSVEFRLPAAAASDDPVCEGAPSLLFRGAGI